MFVYMLDDFVVVCLMLFVIKHKLHINHGLSFDVVCECSQLKSSPYVNGKQSLK